MVRVFSSVRAQRPLVHLITNGVTAEFCANGLLALGARAVMAEAPQEVEEVVALAQALVLNLGQLTESKVKAMVKAARRAEQLGLPIILDPVGIGASAFRRQALDEVLQVMRPKVVRGNGAEIATLAGHLCGSGVDAMNFSSEQAASDARQVSEELGCVVALSGPKDYVVCQEGEQWIEGGHDRMARVTGTGCLASALMGAAVTVTSPFEAAKAVYANLKLAAQEGAGAPGLGSFRTKLIDHLSHWS